MSLEPTLASEQAAGRLWDAVVVGAGPAGSMATRELARRGAAVLLVDRAQFPRGHKVCGGCLNPRSLKLLQKASLGGLMDRLGALPLTNLRLAAGGSYADISLPTGAGVLRESLDAALVREAISAGAALPSCAAATLQARRLSDRLLGPPLARSRPRLRSRGPDRARGQRPGRKAGRPCCLGGRNESDAAPGNRAHELEPESWSRKPLLVMRRGPSTWPAP